MKEKKELIQYAALCAAAFFLFVHYWDLALHGLGILLKIAQPLLTGCAAAYILNLIMSFYERTLLMGLDKRPTARRAVSILLSLLTLLLILGLIITMIVPELKSCAEILVSSVPAVYDTVMQFLSDNPELTALLPDPASLDVDLQKIVKEFITWLGSGVGKSIFSYLTSFVSVIVNLFVTLVFAIYVLAGKEWLGRQIDRLMIAYCPSKVRAKGLYILRTLDRSFHNFIVGQCTEAVILGVLCMTGMCILRLPYAVMIGVLIGATALIPIFGAYIGGAVGFILIFTESPFQAVLFLVFLVILQQLENQLIYPRVVGSSIGLPGILVFTAVTIGASLFGIAGVLLGIPLTAAGYQILRNDLIKRGK